eukprot:scaffold7504_cov121-Isochrysis_galbana.AAC.1
MRLVAQTRRKPAADGNETAGLQTPAGPGLWPAHEQAHGSADALVPAVVMPPEASKVEQSSGAAGPSGACGSGQDEDEYLMSEVEVEVEESDDDVDGKYCVERE